MFSRRIVVYAPSFDENSGGIAVLHGLAHQLRDIGVEAFLWPFSKPLRFFDNLVHSLRYVLRDRWLFARAFPDTPIAGRADLEDAIVIYPEIVSGNPLRASRVLRWLLYAPGEHTGKIDYGPNDLYAYYNPAFVRDVDNLTNVGLLRVTVKLPCYTRADPEVHRPNFAVLFRKGKARSDLNRHPEDAVIIDNLSHTEVARILQRSSRLYSYDMHSYYNTYAIISGCVPVVVPDPTLTEDEWQPNIKDRYGIAFGEGGVRWAQETRDKALNWIDQQSITEEAELRDFLERLEKVIGKDARIDSSVLAT